jgi:RNA polymerase sigma-70 factor (sigma-E family)
MTSHLPDADFVEYMTDRSAWLRRVAFLMCQDWQQVDDLAQTAMTKLYAHWPRVKKFENPDAYLRRILVNTYLSETRKPWWRRSTSHEMPGLETPAAVPDVETALELRQALAALPPRQRATIVLRYYCDLSVEQTAAELNCSQGTVKSNTARGLAALRIRLEAQAGAA